MLPSRQTILLVEDTVTLAHLYEEFMVREGFAVVVADTGKKALDLLATMTPAAVVLDLFLPDMNGLEILEHLHTTKPDIPVVVVTVNNSVDVAVEAMRKGAYDFIVKPFIAPRLTYTLQNALKISNLENELAKMRAVTSYQSYRGFVGQSAPMQAVYRTIDAVASSRASVFIEGESGTGKELAAMALHRSSPRREKPFIAINCAAIPRELMESMIFGCVKGAFTGAISDQIGAAKAANGGTLFLDEICDMPLELQVKLLRFLQTGEVSAVGSSRVDIVDVRIIAASNKDPREEVKERRLREDLFYRLHVIPLEMPALRDRDDDILILASHFLSRFSAEEKKNFTTLSPEVVRMFRHYPWPGNVRQLENVIRHIVVMNEGHRVEVAMLPKDFQAFAPRPLPDEKPNFTVVEGGLAAEDDKAVWPLWMVEKQTILAALDFAEHDIPRAAALLEVSPSTLYRKLQLWRAANRPPMPVNSNRM